MHHHASAQLSMLSLIPSSQPERNLDGRPEKQHAVKLVLIDGDELAQLMIANGIGVTVKHRYEIKSVDRDYFDTESE